MVDVVAARLLIKIAVGVEVGDIAGVGAQGQVFAQEKLDAGTGTEHEVFIIVAHPDYRANRIDTRWLEQTVLPAFRAK